MYHLHNSQKTTRSGYTRNRSVTVSVILPRKAMSVLDRRHLVDSVRFRRCHPAARLSQRRNFISSHWRRVRYLLRSIPGKLPVTGQLAGRSTDFLSSETISMYSQKPAQLALTMQATWRATTIPIANGYLQPDTPSNVCMFCAKFMSYTR